MPSRQERRKAERDVAKRAPAKAGASSAADRRPALANVDVNVNVNVNPVGDRRTRASDPNVLGAENVADASADAVEDDKEALEAGLHSL